MSEHGTPWRLCWRSSLRKLSWRTQVTVCRMQSINCKLRLPHLPTHLHMLPVFTRFNTCDDLPPLLLPTHVTTSLHPDITGKEVEADDVLVGTLLLVRPGAYVPIDAAVVHGESAVDEGLLTGEAAPVPKRKGTIVFGGSLNAGTSPLTVRLWFTI